MRSLCYIFVVLLSNVTSCNKPNAISTYISWPAIDTVTSIRIPSRDEVAFLDMQITNTSNEPSTFYITPTQYDFGSYASLLASIIDSSDSDRQKADKLLNFLFDFTDHSQSAMHERLPHDPLRLVSSFQSGLCDDRNTALSKLFELAGLQSRVYHLGGHVVCEVYYENAWHMYDADWGMCFVADGKAQSVDYIAKHTNAIKLDKKHGYVVREWVAPAVLKRAYGTMDNNYVNDWFGNVKLDYKSELTLNKGDALVIHSEKQVSKQVLSALFGKYAVVSTHHWAALNRIVKMKQDYHLHVEESPYGIRQVSISNASVNDNAVAVYYSCNDSIWMFKGIIGGGSQKITFAPTDANGEKVVFNYKLNFVAVDGKRVDAVYKVSNSILMSEKVLLNGEGFKIVPTADKGVLDLQLSAEHY